MCLGVPGRLSEWLDRDPLLARGWVEFGGIRREIHLACVPEAEVGDYIVVHAGIAISRIDAREAERLLAELRAAGEVTAPPEEEP
jgi:hydrogenase expression/formation protein HypC